MWSEGVETDSLDVPEVTGDPLRRCPYTETMFGDDKNLLKNHWMARPVSVPFLVDVVGTHVIKGPWGDLTQ